MASLVLGVAGAGIATSFGFSASIGYSIGSALGSFLFKPSQPDIEGPRLNDLSVSSSAYGAPIPTAYGTIRVPTNMIWSSGIKETRHKTQVSGGKGGGGGQTQINFTYAVDFQVGISEGTIDSVRRIWADSKIIYNSGGDASIADMADSTVRYDDIRVYLGSETQQPDPLIQSYEGVNIPANRGLANIVFENLQLKEFGNRIPVITVEIVNNGSNTIAVTTAQEIPYLPFTTSNFYGVIPYISDTGASKLFQPLWDAGYTSSTVQVYNVTGDGSLRLHKQFTLPTTGLFQKFRGYDEPVCVSSGGSGAFSYLYVVTYNGSDYIIHRVYSGYFTNTFANGWYGSNGLVCLYKAPYLYVSSYNGVPNNHIVKFVIGDVLGSGGYVSGTPVEPSNFISDLAYYDGDIYALTSTGAVERYDEDSLAYLDTLHTFVASAGGGLATASEMNLYVKNSSEIYIFSQGHIYKWDGTTETDLFGNLSITGGRIEESSHSNFKVFNDNFAVVGSPEDTSGSGNNHLSAGFVTNTISRGTTTLSTIVADQCSKGGLSAGDYDVSELTDNVEGFVASRPTKIRSNIEPLQLAFFFDVVESDYQIKFKKRGSSSIDTIAQDELAAHEYGQTLPDKVVLTRSQDLELPRRIKVSYADINLNYQVNQQYSSRLITQAENEVSIELPIAMYPDKAAQISEIILIADWVQRLGIEGITSNKHLVIDPADIVTITTDEHSYNIRIIQMDYSYPGIIKFKGVLDDASIYSSNVTGADGVLPTNRPNRSLETDLILLDIPIFSKLHDDSAFYAAADGYDDSWPGCILFKSPDGGSTYNEAYSILNPSNIGIATNTLPDGITTEVDKSSSINIVFDNGAPSSITDTAFLNEVNAAAIGSGVNWEIIYFRDVTLESDGSYTISYLLRGRYGTEWMTSLHTNSENFITLSSSTLLRMIYDTTLNSATYYKAAAIGQRIIDVDAQSFTNTGIGLRPYAPSQLTSRRTSSGDIDFRWLRRSRYSGEWRDNIDVPLGEDSESYEIDVLDGSTVVRTITASADGDTAYSTYTNAQQVTDFGTARLSYSINIYQLSATYGRGKALSGVIGSRALKLDANQYSSTNLSITNNYTLTKIASAGTYDSALGDFYINGGKYYMEVKRISGSGRCAMGFTVPGFPLEGSLIGYTTDSWALVQDLFDTVLRHNGNLDYTFPYSIIGDDVLRIAIDMNNGYIWFQLNNYGWEGGGDPAAGTSPSYSNLGGKTLTFAATLYSAVGSAIKIFTGVEAFTYNIPSGFKAISRNNSFKY